MKPGEYENQAMRTSNSDNVDVIKTDPTQLRILLGTLISTCQSLDAIKKKIAYLKKDSMHENELALNKQEWERLFRIDVNPEIIHACLGIITESGEIAEAIFKWLFDEKELDLINLMEESGDIDWYQALLDTQIGTTQEQRWDRNIAKLRARFPDKFDSDLAAIHNRNLEKERSVLESKDAR